MLKAIALFLFLVVPVSAYATPDWATVTQVSGTSQSNYVSSAEAAVCHVVVTGVGVTVGDKIELIDSTTSSGNDKLTVAAATANFTVVVPYSPCNLFTTGIYYKETKSSGTLYTDIQYLNAI